MNTNHMPKYIVGAVIIVAIVGVLSLLMTGTSNNLTGQAVGDPLCTDTDGGFNYTTQGNISGGTWKTTGATYADKTDSCVTSGKKAGMLLEGFCSDATHGFYNYVSCATKVGAGYVCINGACILDSDSDGVADADDACSGYDDADDADGDSTPDGCDDDDDGDGYSDADEATAGTNSLDASDYPLPDLIADEDSTAVTITKGVAYVRSDGVVVGLDSISGSGYTDIGLSCGISNAGVGTASGRSYSYCYFKDAEGGSTISNTFTNDELSLVQSAVHTWEEEGGDFAATSPSNTQSDEVALMSWLTAYYADSTTQAYVLYDVDYHSSNNIDEANEANNEEWIAVDADVTITWETADFECTSDSHCEESETCSDDGMCV